MNKSRWGRRFRLPTFFFAAFALHAASFDAASIKPAAVSHSREGGNRHRIEYTPTSLTMFNVSLEDCIEWAYGVAHFQVPDAHLSAGTYDILARTASPVTVSELRLRLQDLLASRFKLALHRDTRTLPVYELVVAKGGPKLPAPNAGRAGIHQAESLPRVRNGAFVFAGVSLPEFARMLMQLNGVDLPVLDRTGINGYYRSALRHHSGSIRTEARNRQSPPRGPHHRPRRAPVRELSTAGGFACQLFRASQASAPDSCP